MNRCSSVMLCCLASSAIPMTVVHASAGRATNVTRIHWPIGSCPGQSAFPMLSLTRTTFGAVSPSCAVNGRPLMIRVPITWK